MDRIEYNIELLRRRISPEYNLLNHVVTKSPLILPALGLVAGILLHEHFRLYAALILIAIFIVLAFLAFKNQNRRAVIALLALAMGITLGFSRMVFFTKLPAGHINTYSFNEKVPQVIGAVVLTSPRKQPPDEWRFSFAKFGTKRTSLYAKVTSVFDGKVHQKSNGKVFVTLPYDTDSQIFQNLIPGTHIEMDCLMKQPVNQQNPGEFDFAGYLKNKQIKHIAFINDIKAITITGHEKYTLNHLSGKLRAKCLQLLSEGFKAEEPVLKIATAVVLGERSTLSQCFYESLRKSGLVHLLSLSGLHVGVIAAMIWWLGKLFALTNKQRGAICLVLLLLFCLAVPPRSPVIRAAVVCMVFCFSAILGKRAISFNTLAIGAIILLLYNPRNLFTPGFILSFLSISGIFMFYKPIQLKLISFFRVEQLGRGFVRWLCYYILSALTMGISAVLYGFGAVLFLFYGTNIFSPLWTVLAMPVFTLLLLTGLLKIPAVAIIPGAEHILNPILTASASVFVKIIEFTATLPVGFIQTGKVNTAAIFALYVSLTALAFAIHYQKKRVKMFSAIAVVIVLMVFFVNKWNNSHPSGLRLTVFSVGHGSCACVVLPDSSCYILDCGSNNIDDLGRNLIMNYAAYRDIKTVDAVILSHNHLDHVNGIDGVIESLNPEEIIVNDHFCNKNRSVARSVMEIGDGKICSQPEAFSDCNADFSFYSSANVAQDDINGQSLVTFINYAGRQIMIPGDLTPEQQLDMLKSIPDIKTDILILPHHGFAKWSDPLLLKKTEPVIAIGSCKETDYQKRKLKHEDIAAYYTATSGCIELLIKPNGSIKVVTMN